MRLKPLYFFNILGSIILVVFFVVYYKFQQIQHLIVKTNYQTNIKYIQNITTNISEDIKNYINMKTLKKPNVRKVLEDELSLFVTDRYKYIYIVDRKNGKFRFLLDGSKDDKALFLENYEPIEVNRWNEVYKTKKPTYFTHKNIEILWITYLKPIIKNNKVIAILVVDFSMKEHLKIENSLKKLNNIFVILIYFFIFTFLIIVWFSFVDYKREKELYELNKTLEKKVKEEIAKNRAKEKQLLYQSRLAQMGEMISMIAHQWRQPLSAISSVAISVKLKSQLESLDKNFLNDKMDRVISYTKHLSNTIEDFRNFFKPTKQKELVSYEEIMSSILEIIGISLQNKGIKLNLKIFHKRKFLVFSNELKQVILNLIKNAEDALNDKDEKKINITIYKKDSKIIFEIEDNGGGIKENIQDKIFEPYFSTKNSKNGTGLGLYMSKMIVEKHLEGEISFYNSENGAVFQIIIKDKV